MVAPHLCTSGMGDHLGVKVPRRKRWCQLPAEGIGVVARRIRKEAPFIGLFVTRCAGTFSDATQPMLPTRSGRWGVCRS
jgi:hypothetical protein